jgi:hypothetical protein
LNEPDELYKVYAAWTGELHFYVVRELNRHVDCEFFPDSWKFAIYEGHVQDGYIGGYGDLPVTVPGLHRPAGEAREVIQLPRPQDNPTKAQLDGVFRDLCLAAARVLAIDLGKPKLAAPEKKHALPRRRLRKK